MKFKILKNLILSIYNDCFVLSHYEKNVSNAKMIGKICIDFYEPYPKNPKIAKMFKEIGLADELGSGVSLKNKIEKRHDKKT